VVVARQADLSDWLGAAGRCASTGDVLIRYKSKHKRRQCGLETGADACGLRIESFVDADPQRYRDLRNQETSIDDMPSLRTKHRDGGIARFRDGASLMRAGRHSVSRR